MSWFLFPAWHRFLVGDHIECEDNWWDSCALDAGEMGFACYLDYFTSSNGKVGRIHLLALALSIANSLQQMEYKSHRLAVLYLQLITTLVYIWFKILYTIRSRPVYLDLIVH